MIASPALPHQTQHSRQTIEDWIEYMIDYLDHIDPDPDLEDTGDYEPYLAASGGSSWSSAGVFDGREQDVSEFDSGKLIIGGNEQPSTTEIVP